MAQDLQHFIREVWAPEVQENATKKQVAMDICNVVELADGDTYNSPYSSDPSTGTYTPNATSGAVSATEITSTNEALSIATAKYSSFKIDKVNKKQLSYDLQGFLKKRAIYKLSDLIDASILAEYANAKNDVDEGSIGGTAGVPIGLTSSNVVDVILAGLDKLAQESVNVDDGETFLVMDPTSYYRYLQKYLVGTGYQLGDEAIARGYKGTIENVHIYTSLNLTQSVVSSYASRHWLMGKKGAISFGKNAGDKINLEVVENPVLSDGTISLATQYILWSLWGKKTFTEGARELLDVNVRI